MHEDPDRLPDGVPHPVVALTAFYSVTLAIVVVMALRHEQLSLVVLAGLAIPAIVAKLVSKSERDRDHLHPSR
jgi:hypothetical protein